MFLPEIVPPWKALFRGHFLCLNRRHKTYRLNDLNLAFCYAAVQWRISRGKLLKTISHPALARKAPFENSASRRTFSDLRGAMFAIYCKKSYADSSFPSKVRG